MPTHFQRQSYRCAPVAADAKVPQIARELEIFLEKESRNHLRHSRRLRSSFDEILAPAVTFAITRLRRTASPAAKRIVARSAWNDLRQHLAARLAFTLAPTLRLQQNVAKAVVRSLDVGNKRRNRRLHSEITLLETFTDFPDIRETAARLISAWIDAQHELLIRVLRDQADLCSRLLHDRQIFHVTSIRPGLSDPHDGGKTATIIRISGDQRAIYKPRSCELEQLWFEVLRWLNQNGIEVTFRLPKLLPRTNYHWMEFLPTTSCRNLRAVRLFYFRWGAQAAVAQILAATDLHRENWLAIGSQPILVDAELIGDTESRLHSRRMNHVDRQSLTALLRTGLLPLTPRDRVGSYRGIAPFDATIPKTAPPRCWPRYRRTAQQPSRYLNDVVRGFDAVVGVFGRKAVAGRFFREMILPHSRQRDGRVLLRASSQYARLLCESFEARNMVSAGERWRRLKSECCASAVDRRVGLAEARALLRSDIPKFTMRRRTVSASWKRFSAAIAELKDSPRLLRRRVLLGTRIHRVKRAT